MSIYDAYNPKYDSMTALKILTKEVLNLLKSDCKTKDYYVNFIRLMEIYKYDTFSTTDKSEVKVRKILENVHANCFPKFDKEEVCDYVCYVLNADMDGKLNEGKGDIIIVSHYVKEILLEIEKIQNEKY